MKSRFLLVLLAGIASGAQWTIGVYMCADNGMNDQAYVDMAEMMAIGSTSEVSIVVQVDNAARDSVPGCRRYLIAKNKRYLLADLGEVDMADTLEIAGFAGFLAKRFPAENYGFIFWDHGNGWYPADSQQVPMVRSILQDESHNSYVSVAGGELRAAVRRGRQQLGKRFRLLGFDACLMGSVEVGAEVAEHADYLLASEGLVPWGGFQYDEMLGILVARPTMLPTEFLELMCEQYVAAYPGADVCLSGVDLRQLERVLPVLRQTLAAIDPRAPELADARRQVQTFSSYSGRPPVPADDIIDFVDFWDRAELANSAGLRSTLVPLVVANEAQAGVAGALGIAQWFPDRYVEFKSLAADYSGLALEDSASVLEFLNDYYGRDDVRPTRPALLDHRLGGRTDLRLWWSSSADFAPVTYDLYEAESVSVAFSDYCEELSRWSAIGWDTSRQYGRSLPYSFFSGAGPNLDNQLVLVSALDLGQGGLLSCYCYYETEDNADSLGAPKRDVWLIEWCPGPPWDWQPLDSLYGSAKYWQELRYLLPGTDRCHLRFRYRTDGSDNRLGVFIDDIEVLGFGNSRRVGAGIADTTFYLFGLAHEDYQYFVTARDSYGNVSAASQSYPVGVAGYAEPYTRPAPFAGACTLQFDFPAGETPDVGIYTLSGTLVRRFDNVTTRSLYWDGLNESGRALADGLYLVAVQGQKFRKLGKIAKVRQ